MTPIYPQSTPQPGHRKRSGDAASVEAATNCEPEHVGEHAATAGDYFRREGIRVLSARYRELSERAKRRMPTPVERSELDRCELALNTLQAMGGGDARS